MGVLRTRALRRRLLGLPLPEPFSLTGLIANMEDLSGRRIVVCPVDDRNTDLRTACGLRARTPQATFIVYRQRPTVLQTEHVLLHELVHEFFDHGTNLSAPELAELVAPQVQQSLLKSLGPHAVLQARARYDRPEEAEAELSASLIKDAVRRQRWGGDDMVSLLESSLAHPVAAVRRRQS